MSYDNKPKPQYPPKPKIALDNDKLKLHTPVSGQPGKKSSLTWGMYQNNPRIVVYTNCEASATRENDYGKITAALDAIAFEGLMDLLELITTSPNDTRYKLENSNFTFFGGRRSESPSVVSEVWVGKDKEGVMWISVTAQGRPKIKFEFMFSDYHHFFTADGNSLPKPTASVMACKAYCKVLSGMYKTMLVTGYIDPGIAKAAKEAKEAGGVGNYAGGQAKQYAAQAAAPTNDFDDDIPF